MNTPLHPEGKPSSIYCRPTPLPSGISWASDPPPPPPPPWNFQFPPLWESGYFLELHNRTVIVDSD